MLFIAFIAYCANILSYSNKNYEEKEENWKSNQTPWNSKHRNIILCRTFGKTMIRKQRFFRKIQKDHIKALSSNNYYKYEEDGC